MNILLVPCCLSSLLRTENVTIVLLLLLLSVTIFFGTTAKSVVAGNRSKTTSNMVEALRQSNEALNPLRRSWGNESRKAILYEKRAQKAYENQQKRALPLLIKAAHFHLRAGNYDRSKQILNRLRTTLRSSTERNLTPRLMKINRLKSLVKIRKLINQNCYISDTDGCFLTSLSWDDPPGLSSEAESLIKNNLALFPDDYRQQWLLNMVASVDPKYPNNVPDDWFISTFHDDTTAGGTKHYKNVSARTKVDQLGYVGDVSIGDFNSDGYLDLIVSSAGLAKNQLTFFTNQPNGQFNDETRKAGLKGLTQGFTLAKADFNNDGTLDLYVGRGGMKGADGLLPDSLLKNKGDGRFTDVTRDMNLFEKSATQVARWGDCNNDGWIDLFLGYNNVKEGLMYDLLINQSGQKFHTITKSFDLDVNKPIRGAAWGDVNNDGWSDLFISVQGGKNRLLLNRRGTKRCRFSEVSETAGIQQPKKSFSTWFWDYNNDGLRDIFVARSKGGTENPAAYYAKVDRGIEPKNSKPIIYRNKGNNEFERIEFPTNSPASYIMGSNFGDINLDGFPDLFFGTGAAAMDALVPNKMYINTHGRSFRDVTQTGSFGHLLKGHGIGFGDFNNNGRPEIYGVMGGAYEGDPGRNVLIANTRPPQNHWISIKLRGKKSNRAAIGAHLKIIAEDQPSGDTRSIHHTISSGSSFGGNSLRAEIGLGQSTMIKFLRVDWPHHESNSQVFRDIKVNQHLTITEGNSRVTRRNLSSYEFPPPD